MAQVVIFAGESVDVGEAVIVGDIPAPPADFRPLPMLWSAMREAFHGRIHGGIHDDVFRMCLLASTNPPSSDREDFVADHRERCAALWNMKRRMVEAMDLLANGKPKQYAIIIRGEVTGVHEAAAWLPDNITIYCQPRQR